MTKEEREKLKQVAARVKGAYAKAVAEGADPSHWATYRDYEKSVRDPAVVLSLIEEIERLEKELRASK